jgi:hypothetical protein
MERHLTRIPRAPLALATVAVVALVAGCGGGSSSMGQDGGGSFGSGPASSSSSSTREAGADCYLHLFDADRFSKDDGDFKLTKPGRYASLEHLPGAEQDWTDQADSLRVGSGATVTIWPETKFRGRPLKLKPGSQQPDLDKEPASLKMSC